MYKTFKTYIVFTGLDVSKEVEVKETVEDVKEPEVIEKKSDSNIELVKVVASDIVNNLSPNTMVAKSVNNFYSYQGSHKCLEF